MQKNQKMKFQSITKMGTYQKVQNDLKVQGRKILGAKKEKIIYNLEQMEYLKFEGQLEQKAQQLKIQSIFGREYKLEGVVIIQRDKRKERG
ncbi:unnamed protein product [Paramecium sonneborni]|uniref:Uncharacterized protein n=1 Tax=Paramecium sonneborni TaxID=65129 RepID=A0A8S1RS15_9CILI|nr:unnamed protein product [Paramecium sonneborni]